ncbi:MAG: hypothetical protein EXS59_01365 [Candidatus Taylorbacteria bacterium]|nr:hypothetical protein [Candidatus Taylorbacteria bacterium]
MRDFERRRKVKKILESPLVLIPMAIFIVFLARSTWDLYLKRKVSVSDLNLASERLARLDDRKDKLASAINSLQTETGIEGEIRDRLQRAREGEKEVVIVDGESVTKKIEFDSKSGFLQKIWDFFTIR